MLPPSTSPAGPQATGAASEWTPPPRRGSSSVLEDLLDALAPGVVLTDTVGRVGYGNAEARRTLGLGQQALGELDAGALLGLSLRESCTWEGEPERRSEAHFTNLAGEPTHLGVSIRPFRRDGEHLGYVLLFRVLGKDGLPDESSMRHLERLASIGQMVAGFAHEVRNPLAALRALADDLLVELGEGDPRAEHAVRIARNVRRLEDLIRNSLQFARPTHPTAMRHSSRTIVNAALELVGPRLKELGGGEGTILVEIEPGVRDVVVDDGQLVQVLVILLNNALDATQDPTQVSLRVRDQGLLARPGSSRVLIEVEDRGPGIPRDRLGQIFNAFYTTKDTGTGLGLSIALKLVRENRGRLVVRSEPGEGTVFTVDLEGVGP